MVQQHRRDWEPIPTLLPQQAWQRINDGGATLIDVREPYEYAREHAEGTINIPLSELGERYQEIPQVGDVLFICHVGQRSLVAATFMRRQGWNQVFNVEGGTEQWEASELPMRQGNG